MSRAELSRSMRRLSLAFFGFGQPQLSSKLEAFLGRTQARSLRAEGPRPRLTMNTRVPFFHDSRYMYIKLQQKGATAYKLQVL